MDKIWSWLSFRIPRKLAYFAAIRVGANATQGKWGTTEVPALTFMDALERWED